MEVMVDKGMEVNPIEVEQTIEEERMDFRIGMEAGQVFRIE